MDADRELARKNALLGWALFGVFVLLFAGTIAVAFIYLALD
jgi:nitrogen fixation protein FixH